jgi:NAD/NADP transhydrogenase beta subunit
VTGKDIERFTRTAQPHRHGVVNAQPPKKPMALSTGWLVLVSGGAVGAAVGLYAARTVQMTAMPQLVSLFNAVGGGAAALLAVQRGRLSTTR